MTVGELISELRRFDEDENIYVGEYQDYGCDFVEMVCGSKETRRDV